MTVHAFIETEILYNNQKYKYYRPSQAREIHLTYCSNRGFMPSLKPHLKGLKLDYESQLERDFLMLLDHDPNCVDLQPQPVVIPYKTSTGKDAKIFPDCWAYFTNNREFLFEVKSERNYRKLIEDKNWKFRFDAIQEFCNQRGWTYQVITDLKINCVRLNNIKDLIMSAKHFSPVKLNKEYGAFYSHLERFLESPKSLQMLSKLLKPFVPLDLGEIIALLKFNIYYQNIYIDWNKPLEETEISLQQLTPLIPIYELKENEDSQSNYISVNFDKDSKTVLRTDKEKEKFKERMNLIKPLIEKYGKDGTKSVVKNHCKENEKPFYKTYKYYLLYKKEGIESLYPKWSKKHSKSHLDAKVEELLQDALYQYNHGKWSQMKPVWEKFKRKCQKRGLKAASYKTFTNRVKNLPATERRGKYKPPTQSNISKGLSGTYREGRYPGYIIQMDHTPLDIWLVDPLTHQPVGRPHLTFGIDVFSRSIWSYFLSFKNPSRETVLQTIIRGLIPKDNLFDWKVFESQKIKEGFDPNQYELPCAGFPGILQVDNGMDFRAGEVEDFCMIKNITLEYRPVRTPEYGGFVESAWNTINTAIRNAKLPGRVFPQQKTRKSISKPKFKAPPGYDPKKDASLTLEEFREWLFNYLIVKYSADVKANQNQSPNEMWIDGITGNRYQPMGGALRTMEIEDFVLYDFEAKKEVNATLSQKGFRYKNIYYSSEWLKEARKKKILLDKKKYKFKVSHWDIRYAHMKNPLNNEIETLEAYNYSNDDRI
ncbi:MAG: DDE-type integrase/transposase/recombinase, partial [Candidatus Lokiarchaeota archaeon]|nr:DDE-type integrase/transposase/recombinase [Candidatus Lokiarchaeota archaeon]